MVQKGRGIQTSNADISKATDMLDYKPDFNFQNGIELAVDWYVEKFKSNDDSFA
jgi:UDP-N-acetylglucosamine 4-epimerase